MSCLFEMYELATCVIWPAFSANVIFDRQSAVDTHPAAASASGACAATVTTPETRPSRPAPTAMTRRIRAALPEKSNIIFIDLRSHELSTARTEPQVDAASPARTRQVFRRNERPN